MSGWIKMHRSLLEWEWYTDVNVRITFLHMLLRANYKDQNLKGEVIPRGSFPFGRNELAKEIGISVQSLRTAIRKLESTNEISLKSTSKGTIATLCKYNDYQDQSTSESTNDQPATNQQLTTIERKKERKNINSTSIADEIYSAYPKKVGKAAAIKSIQKACKKINPDDLLSIVKVYAEKIQWKDKQYIPAPSTWFNQERWEDDQSEWINVKLNSSIDLFKPKV